jgi:hypothetical protein
MKSLRSLMVGALAAGLLVTAGYAGIYNFPFASSTATSRSAATLPMTGAECIAGDTNLSGGRAPQTACYTQGDLKGNYITSITSAATTVSWAVNDNANLYKLALGGNNTLANPTGLVTGQSVRLLVVQDSAGSRTLTWGSMFTWPAKSGGLTTAPTLSTTGSTADMFVFTYDGTRLLSDRNQTAGQGLAQ